MTDRSGLFLPAGGNSDAIELGSQTKVVDGNWHHIAMTYDKKDAKLYINGKEEAKVAFGENPTTLPSIG